MLVHAGFLELLSGSWICLSGWLWPWIRRSTGKRILIETLVCLIQRLKIWTEIQPLILVIGSDWQRTNRNPNEIQIENQLVTLVLIGIGNDLLVTVLDSQPGIHVLCLCPSLLFVVHACLLLILGHGHDLCLDVYRKFGTEVLSGSLMSWCEKLWCPSVHEQVAADRCHAEPCTGPPRVPLLGSSVPRDPRP